MAVCLYKSSCPCISPVPPYYASLRPSNTVTSQLAGIWSYQVGRNHQSSDYKALAVVSVCRKKGHVLASVQHPYLKLIGWSNYHMYTAYV